MAAEEAKVGFQATFVSHVLGSISLLMGMWFGLVYLLMLISSVWGEEFESGLLSEGRPILLPVGVGLCLLGVTLQLPRIMAFFRQRRSRYALNSFLLAFLAAQLLILVNYVASRQNLWRWDLTSEGFYTLSEESQQLLGHLENEVRIVKLLPAGAGQEALDRLLDQYEAASRNVTVARHQLEMLTSEQIKALQEELEIEVYADLLGIAVQIGRTGSDGKWTPIESKHIGVYELWARASSNGARVHFGEQKISSAIQELTRGEKPRVYFCEGVGNEAYSLTDFTGRTGLGSLAKILRSKNYDLSRLELMSVKGRLVPDDADLLVVAAPGRKLTDEELAGIKAYLDRGGNALFLLEPVHGPHPAPSLPREWVATGLEDLLKRELGILAHDLYVVRNRTDPRLLHRVGCNYFGRPREGQGGRPRWHPVVERLARNGKYVEFSGARWVEANPGVPGVTSDLIAQIHPDLITESEQRKEPEYYTVPDPTRDHGPQNQAGLRPGALALAVAAERQLEGDRRNRVVVFGDADFVGKGYVETDQTSNLELFQNAVAWALHQEERMVGEARRPRSFRLEMQVDQANFFKLLALFGLPALAIFAGVFAWQVRNR